MTGPAPVHGPPRVLSVDDYADRARAKLDAHTWDFIEGGAGDERTLARNRRAFDRVRLRTRVLSGVDTCDTSTTVLGRRWAAPVAVAPLAYHTLAAAEGEVATVRGAAATGLPVVVSTFAGRTFEDIAAAATGPLWLQVYCFRDRTTTRRLIQRAERAGFEALVLTVDTPRLGRRLRDLRNGFRLPAHVAPANLPGSGADYSVPAEHGRTALDPALTWSVVEWLRSISTLPVLVKGIMSDTDARRACAAGVDGIVVSNHGGRQLDGLPATLDVLAEITAAVDGCCPVLLDGGVRRGTDVLASLALGADAVLLGRPVLHALAVGGRRGVADVLRTLTDELADAMVLTGTAAVPDADPSLLARPVAEAADRADPSPGEPAAAAPGAPVRTARPGLWREDLHACVSDPVLDTMNFLNEITSRFPEAVSFAPGRPYEGFFETEEIFTHLRRYLDHLARRGAGADDVRTAMFQYGPTAGHIRELIADSLRKDEDIDVEPESIVVTVGAQEAMLLTLRALFAAPGDVLLVASPCYPGITGAASLLDIPVTAVEERDDGFAPADLERALRTEQARGRRPRAFYVVPDHSNPSGSTMSPSARAAVLELAARHDLTVLEDSPYRLVSPGRQQPTLKSLDHDRRVVHLGSYSKTVFPGARLGFVVADQRVRRTSGEVSLLADELAKIKSMVTVNTPALSQAAIAGALLAADGRLTDVNALPAKHYGEALQVTLEQLERHFPPVRRSDLGVSWNEPRGGFFLTVRVPFAADDGALLRSAEEFGVIWTPMAYFHPRGGGERAMRLSFSYLPHARIAEGISRLARFVEAEADRAGPGPGTQGGAR